MNIVRTWSKNIWRAACLVRAGRPHRRRQEQNRKPADVFGMERVSPHLAWAVPMQGGPIRTLLVAPRYTLRDGVELAERIDLDLETAPLWDSSHVGLESAEGRPEFAHYTNSSALAALRDALAGDYDLIILGNLDASVFPEDLLAALIEKVKAGPGCSSPTWIPAWLPRSNRSSKPSPPIPLAPKSHAAWANRLARSGIPVCNSSRPCPLKTPASPNWTILAPRPRRTVSFPRYPTPHTPRPNILTPTSPSSPGPRDWAAHRSPSIAITGLTLADPHRAQRYQHPAGFPEEYVQVIKNSGAKLAYHTYRVALSAPAQQNLTVQWQMREPGFKTVLSRPLPAGVAKAPRPLTFKSSPGQGTHYVDVWLVDRKGVIDWYSEPITLDGWPVLSEVRYSKSVLLANDSLDIAATVKPTFNQPRPCVLYARAKDCFGSLVAEKYVNVSENGGAGHDSTRVCRPDRRKRHGRSLRRR